MVVCEEISDFPARKALLPGMVKNKTKKLTYCVINENKSAGLVSDVILAGFCARETMIAEVGIKNQIKKEVNVFHEISLNLNFSFPLASCTGSSPTI